LRSRLGVTQEDFATDAGFDRGYISGVERGVRNPSARFLERIAAALDVDAAELFDLEKAREF
jgi:transcriptional regulator with XRE-family HTH domain